MNKFLKWFYALDTNKLVDEINQYVEDNNLQIITLTTNDDQHSAVVLFEGDKPWY